MNFRTSLSLMLFSFIVNISFAMPVKEKKMPMAEFLTEANVTSLEDFMALTPQSYKKITGKKMKLKNRVLLKVAQAKINQYSGNVLPLPADSRSVEGIILIILAVVVPPVAVFLAEGLSGNFWLNLLLFLAAAVFWGAGILSILGLGCWILAVVHALLLVL